MKIATCPSTDIKGLLSEMFEKIKRHDFIVEPYAEADLIYNTFTQDIGIAVTKDKLKDLLVFDNDWIDPCLKESNGSLFADPVILLCYYLLMNYPGALRTHWPLSQEELQSVYKGFGFSFANY